MHSRLALALLLLSVPAASAESPVASAPATAIDNYLTPFVDTNNFSGVVLVARGGEPVFAKGDLGAHSAREGSLHRPQLLGPGRAATRCQRRDHRSEIRSVHGRTDQKLAAPAHVWFSGHWCVT